MPAGGRRPGAGRPKGRWDDRKKAMELAIQKLKEETSIDDPNLQPLDFMLLLMRSPNVHPAIRIEAARAALPYMHSRMEAMPPALDVDAGPATHTVTHLIEPASLPASTPGGDTKEK